MKRLASYCFVFATFAAVTGMGMGIFMAASHDHSLAPAHAHLNLLGWVSMALYGLYYQTHPEIAARRLALAQVSLAVFSIVLLIPGIVIANLGGTELPAVIGALLALASMLLFLGITVAALIRDAQTV
ncbi:hypothetical protein [Martelella limonii]|uniref:hypothetical protein n=1 Tax=Martelella limonii TaxID=1647649 RepID=UPI001580F837|nr:hypothetical protein [Martelella limonii]